MKNYLWLLMVSGLCFASCASKQNISDLTLKDAFKGRFLIGTSINQRQQSLPDSKPTQVIAKQFNTIVAENCMKSEAIHPEPNRYNFAPADEFVNFGLRHKMFIVGHCLIWHSQVAPWFFLDKNGSTITADELKTRMREHIHTIVGRYRGKVKGWDVVNEAIEDNGSYRRSKFYELLGEEFIPLAFQYAHEADPDALLFYNDYSMTAPGRVATVLQMIDKLKRRGIRIDAVGLQCHTSLRSPSVADYERTITAIAQTGCKAMITEMDVSALPSPWGVSGADINQNASYEERMNPYRSGLPTEIQEAWNERVTDLFRMFLRQSKHLLRVNWWGICDGESWLNGFPIHGRTDYPLLYDREMKPKQAVDMIKTEALRARKAKKK